MESDNSPSRYSDNTPRHCILMEFYHYTTDGQAEALADEVLRLRSESGKWLAWSTGRYPDATVGTVVAAYADGSIVLDDGLMTWNPLRALEFVAGGGVLQKEKP